MCVLPVEARAPKAPFTLERSRPLRPGGTVVLFEEDPERAIKFFFQRVKNSAVENRVLQGVLTWFIRKGGDPACIENDTLYFAIVQVVDSFDQRLNPDRRRNGRRAVGMAPGPASLLGTSADSSKCWKGVEHPIGQGAQASRHHRDPHQDHNDAGCLVQPPADATDGTQPAGDPVG